MPISSNKPCNLPCNVSWVNVQAPREFLTLAGGGQLHAFAARLCEEFAYFFAAARCSQNVAFLIPSLMGSNVMGPPAFSWAS